jgi:phosphate transport system permease protein
MPKSDKNKVVKIQKIQDFIFHKLTLSFSVLVLIFLVGIILSLIVSAWPAFKEFGFNFFISTNWDVVNSKFGVVISIYGTLVSALIALVIAVPISFGIALFLTEISPLWLKRPLGTAVELLAAVPSIIYGMFGLFIFAPIFGDYIQPALKSSLGQIPIIGSLFSGPTNGIGVLSAGIILAFLISLLLLAK